MIKTDQSKRYLDIKRVQECEDGESSQGETEDEKLMSSEVLAGLLLARLQRRRVALHDVLPRAANVLRQVVGPVQVSDILKEQQPVQPQQRFKH